jgi:hypothetical protein
MHPAMNRYLVSIFHSFHVHKGYVTGAVSGAPESPLIDGLSNMTDMSAAIIPGNFEVRPLP